MMQTLETLSQLLDSKAVTSAMRTEIAKLLQIPLVLTHMISPRSRPLTQSCCNCLEIQRMLWHCRRTLRFAQIYQQPFCIWIIASKKTSQSGKEDHMTKKKRTRSFSFARWQSLTNTFCIKNEFSSTCFWLNPHSPSIFSACFWASIFPTCF